MHNNHNGQGGHHHGRPMLLKGCPTITPKPSTDGTSGRYSVGYTAVFPNSIHPRDEPAPGSPSLTHDRLNEEWFQTTVSRQRYNSSSEHKIEPESITILDYKESSSDSDLIDDEKMKLKQEEDILPDDSKEGLFNVKALIFLMLWYFFSFCTLFLNKNILSSLHGDPALLGASQLLMTTCLGFIQMYLPCGMYKLVEREGKPPNFLRNMILVGTMRFTTVVLGLVSLKFVAVSFTETIKSSAPIFTVLMARTVLGERFSAFVMLSLVPIMSGLALCTTYELSFNMEGFIAAIATNITECMQNVYSKMLISGEKYRYTPAELQFYTSIASVLVQIPACFFLMDIQGVQKTLDRTMVGALLFNGLFFHLQSISAYVLMGYISPVTHSVANTVKRAFLIWLSVIIFGNSVTFLSGLGTSIVIVGVLLYTKARQYDQRHKEVETKKAAVMQA